jgi:putative transposase
MPAGFFLPVRVLSRLFRRVFLQMLVAAHDSGRLQFFGDHTALVDRAAFAAYLAPLRKAEWVVYSKRPFGGPEEVLAYLSRYTHRVAIAGARRRPRSDARSHSRPRRCSRDVARARLKSFRGTQLKERDIFIAVGVYAEFADDGPTLLNILAALRPASTLEQSESQRISGS